MARRKLISESEREQQVIESMEMISQSKRKLNKMLEGFRVMPRVVKMYSYILEYNVNNFDVEVNDEFGLLEV